MARRNKGEATLYQTQRWLSLRQVILKRDGFTCQMCGVMLREGRSDKANTILRPAVVDHLEPHRGDQWLFYDQRNLWLVCCDCHDGPCQAIEKRQGITGAAVRAAKLAYRVIGLDGYPAMPKGRLVDG